LRLCNRLAQQVVILRDNIGLKTVNEAGISTSPVRWSLPKWVRQVSGESEAVLERFGPGRPFVFHEKDFLTPEEIEAKHAGVHGEGDEVQVTENKPPF
jgi:hypothetical protein